MIRDICKDEAFLAQKAEPAAPEDLPAEQTQQEHNVEAFVPTDYFQQEQPKKRLSRGGIIAICAASVATSGTARPTSSQS